MKNYRNLILISLAVMVVGFYWFQIRPTNIKKDCWVRIEDIKSGNITSKGFSSEYFEIKMGNQETIDSYYANCLKEKGL